MLSLPHEGHFTPESLVPKEESPMVQSKSEAEDAEIKEEDPAINTERKPSESNCYECSKCAKVVTQKVYNYSKTRWGSSLCFDCRKEKK